MNPCWTSTGFLNFHYPYFALFLFRYACWWWLESYEPSSLLWVILLRKTMPTFFSMTFSETICQGPWLCNHKRCSLLPLHLGNALPYPQRILLVSRVPHGSMSEDHVGPYKLVQLRLVALGPCGTLETYSSLGEVTNLHQTNVHLLVDLHICSVCWDGGVLIFQPWWAIVVKLDPGLEYSTTCSPTHKCSSPYEFGCVLNC